MVAGIEARMDELIDQVYAAGLEPERWDGVMSSMRRVFRTSAETFYFLDFRPRRVRPVHLAGIDDRWLACFDELYFTPDNPWVVHTRTLHRPGVVRTNERLAAYTGDSQVLYRSAYYNEWMRPQGFRSTLGNTMLAEQGTIANVTLLRSEDAGSFDRAEVRAFERLSVHLTRALDVAVRLDRALQLREHGAAMFDRLESAVVAVDADGRVLYANLAAESLLRAQAEVRVRDGVLRANGAEDDRALRSLLQRLASPFHDDAPQCGSIALGSGRGTGRLSVSGMRVSGSHSRYLASRPTVLLTLVDRSGRAPGRETLLGRQYRMTPAEARLAQALIEGSSLREAADRQGIGYATARGYLKALFRKTDTHRQGQMVARLLADAGQLR